MLTNLENRVSRKDLFDAKFGDSSSSLEVQSCKGEDEIIYDPPVELEIVEVNSKCLSPNQKKSDQHADEYEFPLFSFNATSDIYETDAKKIGNLTGDGGSGSVKLMKISLREPSSEVYNQERPKEYYFSKYSEGDHQRFASSVIDHNTVVKEAHLGPYKGWPRYRGTILNLAEFNNMIDSQHLREMKLKKRRPGQKQRRARKLGAEHQREREEKAKEIRKMLKKRFHKRGGKKNKKKPVANPLNNADGTPRSKKE